MDTSTKIPMPWHDILSHPTKWGIGWKFLAICLVISCVILAAEWLSSVLVLLLMVLSLRLVPNTKWRRKIFFGGSLGAIGMLVAHGFPYTISGFNYHVPIAEYLRPLFVGALIGMAAGIADRSLKKLLIVPLSTSLFSISGTYLWRAIYEGGSLGEGVAIVGPFLVIIFVASAVSCGVGFGQILSSQEKQAIGERILSLVFRVLGCTALCFLFMGCFYTNAPLQHLIFGFVLGGGSYLIGENN